MFSLFDVHDIAIIIVCLTVLVAVIAVILKAGHNCSKCGKRVPGKWWDREYTCPYCGSKTKRSFIEREHMPDFSHLPVTIRRGKLGKRQTIEIRRDLIRVTETGLFATTWDEPVSAFEGVLRRKGEGSVGDTWVVNHLVELVHTNPKKTLTLYGANTEEDIRKLWDDAASALDLPALDETADGIVARAPEDLDKTIGELVAEGKISVDFDADVPPPRGIAWEQTEDELRVTFSVGIFGRFKKRRIVIRPSELSYFWDDDHESISLNELKSVRQISEITGFLGPVMFRKKWLVMESDTTSVSIGGLGEQQLIWLEQFILAATVAAPS